MRVEPIIPSAARTVGSLRNVGYEAPQAIADLIDNCIAAGASEVDVDIRFEGRMSWIRVADNGTGMTAAVLTEAMRYGSERRYASDDLGRFGFGLKTASTSQCRRVSVASRTSQSRARIEARCLDLAHIERTNRWEVLVLDSDGRPDKLIQPLDSHTGTVVLWDQLDRVLAYEDPFGGWARRRMLALAEEVDAHLGMVFHRFLAGEVRGRPLRIRLNRTRVEPWDPFCLDEKTTETLPPEDIAVDVPGGGGVVRISPYVLPPQAEFSSEAAWRRASGPARWNRQQGIYVYRAHRMIQSGGWCGMRTFDEHSKLARVALDFFPDLDDAFGINISKAIVRLPPELRSNMERLVTAVTRRAQDRYRAGDAGVRRHGSSSPGAGGHAAGGHAGTNGRRGRSTAAVARTAIEGAADRVGERRALTKIVSELRKTEPVVADALGW